MNFDDDGETDPRAMGYVCIDLVKAATGFDLAARRLAARLGYIYIGLSRSSSLIVPEALPEHVLEHHVELLIVPHIAHLRGRVPAALAEITDIHDLATGHIWEREGAYAPEAGHWPNPLILRREES